MRAFINLDPHDIMPIREPSLTSIRMNNLCHDEEG